MQMVAFISEGPVIRKILKSVGLATAPPEPHPPRGQIGFEYGYELGAMQDSMLKSKRGRKS